MNTSIPVPTPQPVNLRPELLAAMADTDRVFKDKKDAVIPRWMRGDLQNYLTAFDKKPEGDRLKTEYLMADASAFILSKDADLNKFRDRAMTLVATTVRLLAERLKVPSSLDVLAELVPAAPAVDVAALTEAQTHIALLERQAAHWQTLNNELLESKEAFVKDTEVKLAAMEKEMKGVIEELELERATKPAPILEASPALDTAVTQLNAKVVELTKQLNDERGQKEEAKDRVSELSRQVEMMSELLKTNREAEGQVDLLNETERLKLCSGLVDAAMADMKKELSGITEMMRESFPLALTGSKGSKMAMELAISKLVDLSV